MDIIATIICYVNWAVQTMWSYAADLFMLILGLLVAAINLALGILPQVAIGRPDLDGSYIGLLNCVIDVGWVLATTEILIIATLLWKLVKFLMKYVQ